MKKYFFALIFLSATLLSNAQRLHTISGTVKDAKTGEDLIGATVYIKELGKGVTTNAYGFYSLSAHEGVYTIIVQYMGYLPQEETVQFTTSMKINFSLKEQVTEMEEVIITAKTKDENVLISAFNNSRFDVNASESNYQSISCR